MRQAVELTMHKRQILIAITTADQFMVARSALCGLIEVTQGVTLSVTFLEE